MDALQRTERIEYGPRLWLRQRLSVERISKQRQPQIMREQLPNLCQQESVAETMSSRLPDVESKRAGNGATRCPRGRLNRLAYSLMFTDIAKRRRNSVQRLSNEFQEIDRTEWLLDERHVIIHVRICRAL